MAQKKLLTNGNVFNAYYYNMLGQKSEHNKDNYQLAIADCTKRIKVLREKREQVIRQLSFNDAAKKELERIEAYLSVKVLY